jgi:hypothetical protein
VKFRNSEEAERCMAEKDRFKPLRIQWAKEDSYSPQGNDSTSSAHTDVKRNQSSHVVTDSQFCFSAYKGKEII